MHMILKSLSISVINLFIMMTLILSPIPFSEISQARAADDQGCEENKNADGSAGIYKVGCEFSKDLSETDAKKHYPEGIAGIVEQFVGVAFAMIGVSLFWKPNTYTVNSCKTSVMEGGAQTFPVVQAGTLAYLIGELKANSEFKKSSKVAVDKNFQTKQMDETVNNKQIASYDALIDVYDTQAKGLKFKKNMALLAEVAFLSATTMEYLSTKKLKVQCETQINTLKTAYQSSLNAINTVNATIPGLQATCASETATGTATQCSEGLVEINRIITTFYAAITKADVEAATATQGSEQKKSNIVSSSIGKVFDFVVGIPGKIYDSIFKRPTEEDKKASLELMKIEADNNLRITKTTLIERQELIVELQTALATYPSPIVTTLGTEVNAILVAVDQLRRQPIQCCGTYALDPTTVTLDTYSVVVPVQANSVTNNTGGGEVTTGGGEVTTGGGEVTTGGGENITEPEELPFMSDAYIKDKAERAYDSVVSWWDRTTFQKPWKTKPEAGFIKFPTEKFKGIPYQYIGLDLSSAYVQEPNIEKVSKFLKPAIENLIYRVVFEKMHKEHKDPVKQLENLAQVGLYTDYILTNGQQTWEESNLKKELAEYKRKYQGDPKSYEQKIGTIIAQLKSQLTITAANASGWKDLLGLGVKAYILHMVMWDWMEAHALNYPKARMWTWGTMAAVNLAVYMFDSKSHKDAEKRAKTVRLEKERFMESHGILAAVEEGGDGSGSGSSGNNGNSNFIASDNGSTGGGPATVTCAVPNGNSFLPAACPAPGPQSGLRIPTVTTDSSGRQITGTLNTGLGAIGTATQALGSNESVDGNKAYQASIKTLEKVAPALRALSSQIIDEADAQDKAASRSLGVKPLSLKSSLAKVKSLFSGNPSSSGVSASNLNTGSKALEETAKKLAKSRGAKFKFKPLAMPKFDTNLGGIGNSGSGFSDSDMESTRQNVMSNLDMNQESISENKDGDIFKMITNRYLINYPTMLNEKKKDSPKDK